MACEIISLSVGEVTLTKRGKMVRRETYIESLPLLKSLYVIKAAATEPHTQQNIQILIDSIYKLNPSK